MSSQIEFDRVEDEEMAAWRRDLKAASEAIYRLGSVGSAHENVSMLMRTIDSHHNFRQTTVCSRTPGSMTWTACTGHARAEFYSCTTNHIVADALRSFRGRELGDRTTDLMLNRLTHIMEEVADSIAADLLPGAWHNDLAIPVTATNHKLCGVKKIVELTWCHYTVTVHEAMLDRRQHLRKLCLDVSMRAELVRNSLGGPESLPDRPRTGMSMDDVGTSMVRQRPKAPATWERGCTLEPRKQKRRRRRRHRRRRKARTSPDPMVSATKEFDAAQHTSCQATASRDDVRTAASCG